MSHVINSLLFTLFICKKLTNAAEWACETGSHSCTRDCHQNGDCTCSSCSSDDWVCIDTGSDTYCTFNCLEQYSCQDAVIYAATTTVTLNCNAPNACDGVKLYCGNPPYLPGGSPTYDWDDFNDNVADCYVNINADNAFPNGEIRCGDDSETLNRCHINVNNNANNDLSSTKYACGSKVNECTVTCLPGQICSFQSGTCDAPVCNIVTTSPTPAPTTNPTTNPTPAPTDCISSTNIDQTLDVSSLTEWNQVVDSQIGEIARSDTFVEINDITECYATNPCIGIKGNPDTSGSSEFYIEKTLDVSSYVSVMIGAEVNTRSLDGGGQPEFGFIDTVCDSNSPIRTEFNHQISDYQHYSGCLTVNVDQCMDMTLRIGGYLSGSGDEIFVTQLILQYQTASPTDNPTPAPTANPTTNPTPAPTSNPTPVPTSNPTRVPTSQPTNDPTNEPTYIPTSDPINYPTQSPTKTPTNNPSFNPTATPTVQPSKTPTEVPTPGPTKEGSVSESTSVSQALQQGENKLSGGSFLDDNLYLMIGTAVIAVLLLIICILWLVFCKRKKNIEKNMDMMQGMELAKVTSVSTDNFNMTNSPMTGEANGAETGNAGHGYEKEEAVSDEAAKIALDPYSDSFALKMWLQSIDLLEYFDLFIEQGFGDKMMALKSLSNEDLKEMGIEKIAHRKVILEQVQNNAQHMANVEEGNYGDTTNDNVPVVDENHKLVVMQQQQEMITAGGGVITQDNNDEDEEEYEYYYEEDNDQEEEEEENINDGLYDKGNTTKQ